MASGSAREGASPSHGHGFDFIVVGAGAAGCVIANRLSADPARRVLLVEAGPSDREFPTSIRTTLPIGNVFLLPHERYNWMHEFSGGPGVNGRTIPCPRGRLMGGCTSVNGTVYMRGHPLDYDEWAALGNPGWAWADVLPFYKRHECYDRHDAGKAAWHGRDGELHVQRPSESNPLAHAFVEAASEAGHALNDDFNGAQQDGFGVFDLNQRHGVRWSSSRAFLHPVMQRANLQVMTDALVERVRVEHGRARGITVRRGGERLEIDAGSEVILAAGTVNSPQLLMLSGIGPAQALRRHGIAVKQDLPGVGLNLQDHPTVSIAMENPGAESYALSWRTAPRAVMAPLRYAFGRTGMLASNAAEAGGFIRSMPGLDRPDVQYTFMVGMKDNPRTLPRRHGYFLHMAVLRPATRGTVELRSADPTAKPLMRPNFLEDRRDVEALQRALREARRIVASPALAALSGAELMPGRAIEDDAALETFIREKVATTYHPVGTCKMGPAADAEAVADAQLCVHGIEGLRVADASIMPNLIGGNTSAPSMMIGERAAHFILR
ncbi:MAG: GMC family oxidoreductase N-terminal domain-containing protein [Rubrivivax sp.]|nr:GMC family oxidoreductase N-terminal domain-containing protein [Rubrivivax sp.]